MHQNSYGAKEIYRSEHNRKGTVIWAANGKKCKYIALFNTDTKERKIKADLTSVLMPDTEYSVSDIWAEKSVGKVKNTLSAVVAPHGARLFKITF